MKRHTPISIRLLQICLMLIIIFLIPATGYLAIKQSMESLWLIKPEEAALPPAVFERGGPTELSTPLPETGPDIEIVSPLADTPNASPLEIMIRFNPRNAPIDLSTLKVTLVKWINIDLTDRIREFVTPEGIHVGNAELPSGEHLVRFSLADQNGDITVKQVKLIVF